MPTTGRGDTRCWLIAQCGRYRKHLLVKKLVTEGEMDECQPTDDASDRAWIEFYGQLRAWLWIQDDVPGGREQAEEKALKALRETPESVVLSDNVRVHVYPKGLDALLWFRVRQRFVSDLNQRVNAIVEQLAFGGPLPDDIIREPTRILERAARELTYQLTLMCAVACTPGPQLPDWATSDDRPATGFLSRHIWRLLARWRGDPLAPFVGMDPVDVLAINRSFIEVNAGRLGALRFIVPPKRPQKPGDEMSYDVFISTVAMKTGQDPEYLAKDRSLVSLVSQVRLAQTPDLEEELAGA